MANPNVDVWGAPDTWVNDYIIRSNDFPQYKAGKPKNAAFRSLMNGNTQNKTPYPMPIDKTICPCGQDPAVSCFGKIHTMSGDSVDDNNNFTPETTIEFETPVNWCFSTGSPATHGWEIRNGFNSVYPPPSTWRWSPNTGELNTNENRNAGVMPFVFYQLKSLLLSIQVLTVEGHATAEYGNTPTNNTGWKSLAEWKSNYSNKLVYAIRFNINWCTSANDTDIVYSGDTQAMGSFDTLQVSLLDGVNLINGSDELYYDYATYQMQAKNNCFYLTNVYTSPRYTPTRRYYLLSADKFENAVLHSTRGSSNNYWSNTWYEIPYSENNYETIMKMVACFGCPFTDTDKQTFRLDYTDTELCLPVIDSDGITHGEYTRGTANTTNDIYNIDSVREKNYDPAKPVDPNTYSDTTNWNNVNFRQAFTKRYILNSTQVGQLSGELWAAQSSKPADLDFQNYAVDEYLTNNPIDTIVSLKYFPCTFDDVAPAIVHLGKYTTNIAATALGTSVRVIDFDPIAIWRHFDDFRDFEPYTQLSVYIPFCGVVPLKTADCMGKYVSVKLCIDTSTGAAAGFVIVSNSGSGGICVATANGTAAIDIPVSGLQSANISNAVFNAAATWAQTQISQFSSTNLLAQFGGTIGNIGKGFAKSFNLNNLKGSIFGGPMGALNAVASLDPSKLWATGAEMELQNTRAEYDLQHVQMPTRLIGSSAPALSSVMETAVRLIIYRPITDKKGLANYADTIGFATLQSGTVSQFSGFTVGTIDVSGINATAAEKQAIAAAFANGVYL